jgi:hypothetical protein
MEEDILGFGDTSANRMDHAVHLLASFKHAISHGFDSNEGT